MTSKRADRRSKKPLLLLLLLLFGGGSIGFGTNWFGLGSVGNGTPSAVESDASQTSENSKEIVEITIQKDKIFYNGTEIRFEDLEGKLKTLAARSEVRLVDQDAIKATYEKVQGVVQDLKIPVTTNSK